MTDTRPQSSASIVERLRAYWPDGPGHQIAWEAAAEIERLTARIRQLEQALSQAGDSIELQEAEQRGFVRGEAEIERLTALVAKAAAWFGDEGNPAAQQHFLNALEARK